MRTQTQLMAALVAALGFAASNSFAAMDARPATWSSSEGQATYGTHGQVARKGADDPLPPQCDDHGTDLCNASTVNVAKKGADDPLPPQCDDHGTDLCNASTVNVARKGA